MHHWCGRCKADTLHVLRLITQAGSNYVCSECGNVVVVLSEAAKQLIKYG